MISDPQVYVTCEHCATSDGYPLTSIARGGYDERDLIPMLLADGWEVNEETGETVCRDCIGSVGTEFCVCGHVEDEHSVSGECQIDECTCGGFDEDEERV